jgi:hypothetical protein
MDSYNEVNKVSKNDMKFLHTLSTTSMMMTAAKTATFQLMQLHQCRARWSNQYPSDSSKLNNIK